MKFNYEKVLWSTPKPLKIEPISLKNQNLLVSGWNNVFQGTAKSIEFNKIQFEQIVGNRDAKHFARRLTERMLSYDFDC